MRYTEFWARMEHHLGPAYAATWASQQSLAELGHRTPIEALDSGVAAKDVWRAVHGALELPPSER